MTVRPVLRVILAVLLLGQLFQSAVSATSAGTSAWHPIPPSITIERGADQLFSQPQKTNPQDGTA
ncbi:MAG TPA: hypothetical protein VF889_09980, partial [Bacteroidota bacterium]